MGVNVNPISGGGGSGGGFWDLESVQETDTSVFNSTAVDTELSLSLEAGKKYLYESNVFIDSVTGLVRERGVLVTDSNVTHSRDKILVFESGALAYSSQTTENNDVISRGGSTTTGQYEGGGVFQWKGYIETDGATTLKVQVRYLSGSGANPVYCRAGSYLVAKEIVE